MEAKIVDSGTYKLATKNIKNIFNTAGFSELNRDKVDDIIYIIVYKGDSPRFGCVFGKSGDEWKSPFTAPYGYIESLKKEQTVANFEDALIEIENVAKGNGCRKIHITLPPAFYDNDVINTWYALMINSGWKEKYVDINFALDIKHLVDDYSEKIHGNARRNLRIAGEAGLQITECKSLAEKKDAYHIIRINRESKGYPLRMSEEQVMQTIEIVPAHMYVVNDHSGMLAASLIYDITDTVAQIVYWGDIPGCQEKKVINYLGCELLKLYSDRGFEYLDIGPSTEKGIPNYGLCDFKDSIGCTRTAKFWLCKEL